MNVEVSLERVTGADRERADGSCVVGAIFGDKSWEGGEQRDGCGHVRADGSHSKSDRT